MSKPRRARSVPQQGDLFANILPPEPAIHLLPPKSAKWSDTPEVKRDAHLRRTYGISSIEYDRMWRAQGGVCAICGEPETTVGGRHGTTPMQLAVDHSHVTGKVRALLCSRCNQGIGGFRENPDLLIAAAQYLCTFAGRDARQAS